MPHNQNTHNSNSNQPTHNYHGNHLQHTNQQNTHNHHNQPKNHNNSPKNISQHQNQPDIHNNLTKDRQHHHSPKDNHHHSPKNNHHHSPKDHHQHHNEHQNRLDEHDFALWKQVETYKIWKMLNNPENNHIDPENPYHIIYNPYNPEQLEKEAMARRMDRKVIKLEAAYGSERQTVYVKRNQDLIVRDLMEEVQHVFKIPIEELVIFHKGTNLGEYMHQTLENLGVENNHQIRVTRDPELPNRSPRSRNIIQQMPPNNGTMRPPPNYNAQQGMDPVSYLKEIAPQRVPDPTPYQVRVYNQQLQNKNQTHNDVIKLYVSFGSEREYLLVHGKKPLVIHDLKLELNKAFKIPTEQQCIVYKGFNLHEYLDDAPLEAFGLENNSQISLWPKSTRAQDDVRLPRGGTPPPQITADLFTPRTNQQGPQLTQRWQPPSELPTEVLKVEVQHGSDRHQIILRGQNKTLTVLDLQNEMERVTAVPVRDQRVFFKSQELHMTPFKTLKECDLENNNCVKLVGDPSKLRYSNYFGRLNPSMPSMDPNDPNMMPVKLNQQLNPGSNQNFKN